MLRKEKLEEISKNLAANQENPISAFRQNLFMYVNDKEITIRDISEASGIPFSSLNSFLYGRTNSMMIDNVVKLAKALDVPVDGLLGVDIIPKITMESMSICKRLPESDLYLVRWFIRYLDALNNGKKPNSHYISVMDLEYIDGNLKMGTNYEKVDISNVSELHMHKIFFGITMPCDNYMPYYTPYDILLIANDRDAFPNEHVVVRFGKNIGIARLGADGGLYSLRDGKYRPSGRYVDEIIGYVIDKITV